MFKIKMADLVIGIDNRYDYVERLCDSYRMDAGTEDFQVSVSEKEILEEKKASSRQCSHSYCESICLYRKICLELIRYDAFVMHSAALELDGEAYSFAAKSGVGKTTHIKLWMQEFGDRVRVINGDKPVYRFRDGVLYACGTPWCGKEHLGNNIMSPVRAICFLERSEKNHICRMEAEEVIGRIFHQMLMPREEADTIRFLDMVDRLLEMVNCYLLQCNMHREAAWLAYEGILQNGRG